MDPPPDGSKDSPIRNGKKVSMGDWGVSPGRVAQSGRPFFNRDLEQTAKNGAKTSQSAKEAAPIVLSRRAASFWILGAGLLLVWVFVLGIIVGRGTIFQSSTFQELEKKLALQEQKKDAPLIETPDQPAQPDAGTTEPELTFYQALSTPEPDPNRGLPDPPAPPRPERLQVSEEVQPRPEAPSEPMPREETEPDVVAQTPGNVVVTSGVKTVAQENSEAPPPQRKSGENFTIQVAAAKNIKDAEAAVKKLLAQGFDAYFYQVELKGRKYFRVRVGRYATVADAKIVMEKLAEKGHSNMFISALTD